MFRKFANAAVIECKTSNQQVANYAGYQKLADMSFKDYQTKDGYVYVRVRAISSRVNLNHDGWPAEELKRSYRTFVGKPIFVDHHNHDPKQARGVIVDAELHQEDAKTSALDPYYSSPDVDSTHLPATWVELLLEIDGKRYPKFAKAFVSGDIDSVSMGADVEYTLCSHCANKATDPGQFCRHIIAKGAYFDYYAPNGQKTSKKSYENCFKIAFFELSGVFVPADETALVREVKSNKHDQLRTAAAWARVAGPYGMDDPDWDGSADPAPEVPLPGDDEGAGSPLHQRAGEEQRVYEWRYQQLLKMGYEPAMADEIAKQEFRGIDDISPRGQVGVDTHELQRAIDQGATPDQAYAIYSKKMHAKSGKCEDCGKESDDLSYRQGDGFLCPECGKKALDAEAITSSRKVADNPIPQSDMTRMPEHVDTLRQEDVCPVCGSDMEDGECTLCGYVEPPEGFNNPDLEKAKDVDEQLRGEQEPTEEPMDQQNEVTPNDVAGASTGTDPTLAKYHTATLGPNGSVTLRSRIAAQQQPVRIQTQEKPLLPAGRRNSDKPLAVRTLKNPTKPIESNYTEKDKMTQRIADGASPQGEGVAADKRVDVTGVGAVSGDPLSGIEHENVEKDTGDFVAPHTDTWSGGQGDSLGQQDPVTSEAFEGAGGNGNSSGNATGVSSPPGRGAAVKTACDCDCPGCKFGKHCSKCDDGDGDGDADDKKSHLIVAKGNQFALIEAGTGRVLKVADTANDLGGPIGENASDGATTDSGTTPDKPSAPGFPDHDPARVQLDSELRQEVGDRTRTFGSDDFHITEPVTNDGHAGELGGPIGVPAPTTALSSFSFAVKAMKLAETEERMGLVKSKWARLAELEGKPEGYVDAQLETLAKVKTAAVRRQASTKTAGRVPSFRGATASFQPEAHSTESVNVDDSLFY